MKKIYEFYWDCGRMGDVDGTFIAESGLVDELIGENVYFGEILGKHSEVYGVLDAKDLEVKSDNQEFIALFEEIMGEDWHSGYNPIETIMDNMRCDDKDRYEELTEKYL